MIVYRGYSIAQEARDRFRCSPGCGIDFGNARSYFRECGNDYERVAMHRDTSALFQRGRKLVDERDDLNSHYAERIHEEEKDRLLAFPRRQYDLI